ncbi:glycosyltransferase family 2 protein [Halioglobus maricola]|uniref:Glycosyltransferase family 2 protein n=1 Tax=Halioglobus maricola TaxID=2601894 RepID=A0A5P9NEY6_9GAMM|nr:glycosyltransferase family 2 protein [Halioglobus maricola]QFU74317.1 glycosyltransferase family 2 protein [Halioglobus maricola]
MSTAARNSGGFTEVDTDSVLLVIPAHNEQANIGIVLEDIRACFPARVVVVDDASQDATADIARAAGVQVIPLASQLGAWGAIQAGLRYAKRHGYEYVVTMDADAQHEARWIPALLEPLLMAEADVAVGAYTLRGSILRKIAWYCIRKVSGLSLDDITSGFRAYNRASIEALAGWRASAYEYQDVGVLMLLAGRNLKVLDVPVSMKQRAYGKSRIFHSWLAVAYYMFHTLLLGFSKRKLLWSRRPVKPEYDL